MRRGFIVVPWALALGLALAGCPREKRDFRSLPADNARTQPVRLVTLQPGAALPAQKYSGPYDGNSYGISQGERLYVQYNCVGCHFHGGGGIGPPLIDDEWLYGYEPQQVYATILQGRPNGMPAFMGKIPDNQVWELSAYVRSMSGLVPSSGAPGRNDDMHGPTPENSVDPAQPKNTRVPS